MGLNGSFIWMKANISRIKLLIKQEETHDYRFWQCWGVQAVFKDHYSNQFVLLERSW